MNSGSMLDISVLNWLTIKLRCQKVYQFHPAVVDDGCERRSVEIGDAVAWSFDSSVRYHIASCSQ